jgi:hypothetical protein
MRTEGRLKISSGMYERCMAIRPLMLKVIRMYSQLKGDAKYTVYLRACYRKARVMIPVLEVEMEELDGYRESVRSVSEQVWGEVTQEREYMRKFTNNLKKIVGMCRETSVSYYTMLPDIMPVDIRTHCVKFIAPADM